MSIITPNFFLVGGPKCGTTAMVEYLRTHPDIFISEPKEPNYFADDIPEMKYVDNLKDYLNLFKKAKAEKIVGDASIFYMFSEEAVKNIHSLYPNAKLLMMIRNPIEMVPSFHQQILFTLDEDNPNLLEVLELEDERIKGNSIPRQCRSSKLLRYSEIAKYSSQIKNIYKYFSKKNVKIVLFDDFKEDNRKSYQEILSYLNLEDDGRTSFPRVNDAKKAKNNFINKIVNRPPKFAKTLAKFTRKLLNKPRLGILNTIDHLNRDRLEKKPLTESERNALIAIYKQDIIETSRLIDRDLSMWLKQ